MTGIYHDDMIRLWRAVLLQALLDSGNLGIKSINPSWPEWKRKQIRDEARQWFKDADEDFIEVCTFCNLDPRATRKFAMRVIRGDPKAKRSLIEWRDWFRRPRKEITPDEHDEHTQERRPYKPIFDSD